MPRPKICRKQVYVEIIKELDPRECYDARKIVEFAQKRQMIKRGPDDSRVTSVPDDILKLRYYRSYWNYQKWLVAYLKRAGFNESLLSGAQWKLAFLDLTPEERLYYTRIHKELELEHKKDLLANLQKIQSEQNRVKQINREIKDLERKRLNLKLDPLIAEQCMAGARKTHDSANKASEKPHVGLWQTMWRKAVWAIAICGLLGVATTATATMMGYKPLELLLKYGVEPAKEALRNKEPESLDTVFERSWLAYHEGEYDKAEKGVFFILAQETVSLRRHADCSYLLGLIQEATGFHEFAIGHYLESYRDYAAEESAANQHQVAVEIANSYVNLGDYIRTEEWLEMAMSHYRDDQALSKKIPDLRHYFLVRLELAVGQQNLRDALNFAFRSWQEAEKSGFNGEIAFYLRTVGFWYIANGCLEQGIDFTQQAQEAANETGDKRQYVFTLINGLLIQRGLGMQLNPESVAYIRDWARIRNDSRLEEVLDLAMRIHIEEYANACKTDPD